MVPGNNKNLPIVFRCPFPEIPQRSYSVFQIENVSGQYEYIARYREFVMFYVSAVLPKLKMQIAHVLYFHITVFYSIVQSAFGLSFLPARMRPE